MGSVKFNGSISDQQNLMVVKALTTDDPEIMEVVNNFFNLTKNRGDGGQTPGSRAVLLMARGIQAFLDDNHQCNTTALTTQSPQPDYTSQKEHQDDEVESDMEISFIEEGL